MKKQIASAILAILVLSLLGTGNAQAKGNCTVGSTVYPTIQSAVDDPTCRHVYIPAGTFYENVSISRDVTVKGEGESTIIDGGGNGTVFLINSGTVVLENMTITNGNSFNGGGIENHDMLSIKHTTVSKNRANASGGSGGWAGGGIYNTGTLSVDKSIISGNFANVVDGFGGGIYNGGGAVVLKDSEISSNAARRGGGIYNSGTLTIKNSTISDNTATREGGGIFSLSPLTIKNSTITSNTARYGGGGIFGGPLTIKNSNITDNIPDNIH
jgi:hypothetical protein